MSSNKAAFLTSGSPRCPLEIKDPPMTAQGPQELVVKNYAVAVNPVDTYKQLLGDALLPFIKLPCVLGSDLAGEAVEVGSAVSRFTVGDRIMGFAAGPLPFGNRPAEGAFQHYTVVREQFAVKIPDSVPFERACVLPVGLCTAAYGLFHDDFLDLDLPRATETIPKRQALIITSGASSVGACAIQLAVAAGYEVYSIASPGNFDMVRSLGASGVYDYHDGNCADIIRSALEGKTVAGALAINPGGIALCAAVLRTVDGAKFIADAGPPPPEGYLEDIKCRFIDTADLGQPEGVVARILRDFAPQALESCSLVPQPEPSIIGRGLESLPEAFEARLRGVSAQKIVVALQ